MSDHAVILLADDSEDDVFLITKAFKKAGIANPIQVVRDGEEAVEYLSGEGKYENRDEYPLPELILLDLKMPRMDGFQVLAWIRVQVAFSGMVVLVLTSSDEASDVRQAYYLGTNSFLVKPGDFKDYQELVRVISRYWMHTVRLPESHRLPKKKKTGTSERA